MLCAEAADRSVINKQREEICKYLALPACCFLATLWPWRNACRELSRWNRRACVSSRHPAATTCLQMLLVSHPASEVFRWSECGKIGWQGCSQMKRGISMTSHQVHVPGLCRPCCTTHCRKPPAAECSVPAGNQTTIQPGHESLHMHHRSCECLMTTSLLRVHCFPCMESSRVAHDTCVPLSIDLPF